MPEGESETEGGAPETDEVIAEAVAEVQEGLRQVMAKGCPPPEVAYEL